ncbi:RNA-binding domain-containing protein [Dentipellis sp. KUC8613]|nr:RNA-binding domain-containing protein [Dentipellis sp. KUC8613]
MASSSSATQPNNTLYINNLNDQINKEELRHQLYALFTTHGKIIDVVALKTAKMRGQAFLVFTDLASATAALRACNGMEFYDKPMRIQYAKTKSFATSRREDPFFVPPTSAFGRAAAELSQAGANGQQKRGREDEEAADGAARGQKREKAEDSDDEEMEIDDDDEGESKPNNSMSCILLCAIYLNWVHPSVRNHPAIVPQAVQRPSQRLLCTNLPQEVTDSVLSVLFQQYQGFQSTQVAPSPTPSASGAPAKMAQVSFDTAELASVAKEALDGFTLKKGWAMTVAYI